MSDSFIFYKSFYDAANQAPDDATKRDILWHLVEVCLGIKTVNDIPFPASAIAVQALASVESAKRRYDQSVKDGGKGGRPQKIVLEEEAMPLFEKYHNCGKVAEELDVDADTLRKYRYAWMKKNRKTEKPKNPNVYDSVSVSESVYDYDSDTRNNNKTPDTTPTDPNGSPSRPTRERVLEWCPPD